MGESQAIPLLIIGTHGMAKLALLLLLKDFSLSNEPQLTQISA